MIKYLEFKEALEILGILSFTNANEVKKRYLKLSRIYHPDIGGDKEKFEKINKAYKIIEDYIKNYKFSFDKEEFNKQFPYNEENELLWDSKSDIK